MLQGFSCPKCGSKNIAILASGVLTYKCLNCGYTWSPKIQGLGYITVKAGEVHWTELKRIIENAQVDVNKLLNSGTIKCDELLSKLQESYGDYLNAHEMIKIALLGIKRHMEEVRYREPQLYSELTNELEKCRKLYYGK